MKDQERIKESFQKVIEAIRIDPGSAVGVLTATTELVEGVRCRGKVRNLPPITVDEPPEMGGTDAGPNPVEMLLVALGACQEISYAVVAALMGISLKKLTVFVEGSIDLRGALGMNDDVPPGYSGLRYETTIESDADENTIRNLVHMAESHCPVLDTITRPVSVTGKVVLKTNGKRLEIS